MNETLLSKVKSNKSAKVIIIAILSLLLNIPLHMVSSQLDSRKENETIALESVKKSWGDILDVHTPYIEISDAKYYPDNSETNVQINVQQKKRGYFNVPVYTATLQMKFKFNPQVNLTKNDSNEKAEKNREPDPSQLIIPFKNANSIGNFKITEVGKGVDLNKTVHSDEIIVLPGLIAGKVFFGKEFIIEIEVRGVDQLNLLTLSKTEKINIKSNWKDMKFEGDSLPTSSLVSDSGIDSNWSLTRIGATTFDTVTVKLLWNNPDYIKIDRIMDYAFLFISLIFMTFFILECVYKNKLHPIQYGAVGIAISIFYLMLLALLEKIGFDAAYIISSVAVVILNTYYMAGSISKIKGVLIIFLVEVLLHVYFYIILSLENMAFLIGSIGLFIALATFMVITRKFDWYESATIKND